jgi:membrane protein DedA with SNARE-associated domain
MSDTVAQLVSAHGYWVVAAFVALESMGIPVPGETALVTAGIYAGTTHRMNIAFVIGAAAMGAIVGDNVGFWIGRRFGHGLLVRYGPRLRISTGDIKLGQYLFMRHGGKVVFFGRFIAVLRTLAALLAGINSMPWASFLFFNATGGVVWSGVFGVGSYMLGTQIERVRGTAAVAGLILAGAGAIAAFLFVRRRQATLMAEAERAFPGPIR